MKKTEIKIACNRKQAEVAFMKLKHLVVKFVSVKKDDTVNFLIIHHKKFNQEVKKIKTIKELFMLEKKLMSLQIKD